MVAYYTNNMLLFYSTATNQLETTFDWTVLQNRNRAVDVTCIDFETKNSLDSVMHTKLLHKLSSSGLPNILTSWISALLTNRSQQVSMKRHLSISTPVTIGVPQGSDSGPVLFVCKRLRKSV